MNTALITVSYGPDVKRCRRLCGTIDKHVTDYLHHLVIIPRRDMPLFADLESKKRKVVAIESMMPGNYVQLPFSNWSIMSSWLRYKNPEGRSAWPRFAAMRGWIVQQLVKLGSFAATPADVLCMIDSDVQFCRPFSCKRFVTDDKLRLQTVEWDRPPSPQHPLWQEAAERLLGLPKEAFRRDYIGNLITWHRDHLQAMLQHIESVHKAPWFIAVGRELRFSEYILYGNFNDRVLKEQSSHLNECPHYCFELWDASEVEELKRGERKLTDEQIAVLIQSKLRLAPDEEQALLNLLEHQPK